MQIEDNSASHLTEVKTSKTETYDDPNSKQSVKQEDSHLVQIKASKSEIDRRISAFIEQKRQEVDEYNRKEFCSVFGNEDSDDSCARVNAVFLSRPGGKSHIKVCRVVNLQGPQTQVISPGKIKQEKTEEVLPGVEERLHNIEEHLKIKTGSKLDKSDVFTRLKQLEERILYLEGISPEYFDHSIPPPKQRKVARFVKQETSTDQDLSLTEIDARMAVLKEKLKRKSVNQSTT